MARTNTTDRDREHSLPPGGTASSRGRLLGWDVLLASHRRPLKAIEVLVSFVHPAQRHAAAPSSDFPSPRRVESSHRRRRGTDVAGALAGRPAPFPAPGTGEPSPTRAASHVVKVRDQSSDSEFRSRPGEVRWPRSLIEASVSPNPVGVFRLQDAERCANTCELPAAREGVCPPLSPGGPHGGQAELPPTSNRSAFSTAQSAVPLDSVPKPLKPLSPWPLECRQVQGPLELAGLGAGAEMPLQGRHPARHPQTQPPSSVLASGMSPADNSSGTGRGFQSSSSSIAGQPTASSAS